MSYRIFLISSFLRAFRQSQPCRSYTVQWWSFGTSEHSGTIQWNRGFRTAPYEFTDTRGFGLPVFYPPLTIPCSCPLPRSFAPSEGFILLITNPVSRVIIDFTIQSTLNPLNSEGEGLILQSPLYICLLGGYYLYSLCTLYRRQRQISDYRLGTIPFLFLQQRKCLLQTRTTLLFR